MSISQQGIYKTIEQRSKLTFSKIRLLATFNCKMVAIKKFLVAKKHFKKNNNIDCNIQGRTLGVRYVMSYYAE